MKFLGVVVLLIERDGRLLLMRRSADKDHAPGAWEPGSGRVEAGETPVMAARREAREETGLDVEVIEPVNTFHFYRGAAREEAIAIAFHCQAAAGPVTLSAEHDEARWVPLDELEAAPVASAQLRECFRCLLTRRRRDQSP